MAKGVGFEQLWFEQWHQPCCFSARGQWLTSIQISSGSRMSQVIWWLDIVLCLGVLKGSLLAKPSGGLHGIATISAIMKATVAQQAVHSSKSWQPLLTSSSCTHVQRHCVAHSQGSNAASQ